MRPFTALRVRSLTLTLATLFPLAGTVLAQSTPERAEPCALKNVRLSSDEGATAKTLLLSGGRIEAILELDAALPLGVRVIEGEGFLALPAFVDGFSAAGCKTPDPMVDRDKPASVQANVRIDMREANRKGIQPSFRAVDVLELDADTAGKYRKSGFGALLSSPRGQLLGGTSVLVTTRDAAMRDLVLRNDPMQHAAFDTSGRGYPGTLMGYHAQLRQFFHDAARHAELVKRWDAGRPGRRPAFDADLDHGRALLAGEQRILCEANGHRDIERWIRLADEFGLDIAISGGRDAWRVAALLKERDIPVFLTLDWGKEVDDPDAKKEKKDSEEGSDEADTDDEGADGPKPNAGAAPRGQEPVEEQVDESVVEEVPIDEEEEAKPDEKESWLYEEPLIVKRENRRLWLEKRDCALRLREAGVRIVFCSGGSSTGDLMKNVRALVEAGFPADEAVAALTVVPAELLGVGDRVGKLEPGYQAAVALWNEHPTKKDAKVACLVVDGIPYEFDVEATDDSPPDEGVDLNGVWIVNFEVEGERAPAQLTLKMAEDGAVTGTYSAENRFDESRPLAGDIAGRVAGKQVKLTSSVSMGEMTLELSFDAEYAKKGFAGTMSMTSSRFDTSMSFTAVKQPEHNLEGGR